MIPYFDGAIILDCSTGDNSSEHDHVTAGYLRPLAPFAIYDLFHSYHIPCTVINYLEFWEPEEITELLVAWCEKSSVKKPLLLCSTLFGHYLTQPEGNTCMCISRIAAEIDAKIILGGHVDLFNKTGYSFPFTPYAIFKGRSLHILEKWITGQEIDPAWISTNKLITVFYNDTTVPPEDPVVPTIHEDYCLSSKDILPFETRLGCKFNCTFCSYPFRNNKHNVDTTSEELHTFFQNAYERHGINRFSCSNDTFNEDDQNLVMLNQATQHLKYSPKIVGYNRLDLMIAKPYQLDLLDQSGFHGHFFGMESLHPETSKLIRKGYNKQKVYDMFAHFKQNYPHWFINTSWIVGLPKEPGEHFVSIIRDLREKKLVDSMLIHPYILKAWENTHDVSDIFAEPEKYGVDKRDYVKNSHFPVSDWHNGIMSFGEAVNLANQLTKENTEHGMPYICAWEWNGQQNWKSKKECQDHVKQYKERKKKYVWGD